MTSLLLSIAELKDLANIPLISKSAENLGSCLNSLLRTGRVIASGDLGSGLQEQVFVSKKFNNRCLGSTIKSVRLAMRWTKSGQLSLSTLHWLHVKKHCLYET